MQNHYYILGAGAMGLLWAARLVQAGLNCTVLKRPGTIETSRPLFFSSLKEEQTEISLHYLPLDQASEKTISNLIVATKAYDLLGAVDSVLPALADNVKVICLANGIGTQQLLMERLNLYFTDAELYWILSNDGAIRIHNDEQSTIRQTGFGTSYIGRLDNTIDRQAALTSLQSLSRLNLDIKFVEPVAPYIWRKFFINCAINPLTAYYDCKNGELLSNPDYRIHFDALINEIEAIAKAIDWRTLNPEVMEDHKQNNAAPGPNNLREAIYRVVEQTAENFSSMCIDFRQQRPNELDFLNAYLVQLANSFQISIPVNQQLLERISEKS